MSSEEIIEGIKVSPNWDCIKPFKWMVENAKFVFCHVSAGRERVSLVVKEPIAGYDCFEIGNDQYGIMVTGCTEFNSTWGGMIDDSSKEIIPFIKEYLIRQGASDLIHNQTK